MKALFGRFLGVLLVLLVAGIAIPVGKMVGDEAWAAWQVHQRLLKMQEEFERRPPLPGNGFVTPKGAAVNFRTFTYLYEAEPTITKADIIAGEEDIRRGICAGRLKPLIKAGATIAYEYRTPTGVTVHHFEIGYCA